MPTLYSPLALWALDFASSEAAGLHDRSGNGRHLVKTTIAAFAPDLIEDAVSPVGSSGDGTKLVQGTLGSADATWAITGAMTVAMRVWFDGDLSRTQVLYQTNYYPYTGLPPVRNVPFTLATVAPDGALLSYAQHGSYTADAYTFTLVPPVAQWCFVTFRRAASGVLTIGIDDVYEDSPVITLPGPTAAGVQLAVLNSNDGIAPLSWGGGMGDMGIWDTRLSDAQLVPLYQTAMGIVPS
jgi:hypothetical protein